jgi:hypothetical protein
MQIHAFLVYDLCSDLDAIIWYIHRPLKLNMVLRLKWSSLIKIRHGVKILINELELLFINNGSSFIMEINQG